MKKIVSIVCLTLLSLLIVSSVLYANLAPPPMINTDELEVGSWAKILQKIGGEKVKIWLGVVGKEKIAGKKYVWVEIRFKQRGQDFIVKSLMRASIKEKASDMKRLIVKIGNQPAMEVPIDMLKMMGQSTDFFGQSENEENAIVEMLGREKVRVPAGTFLANHIKIKEKDGSFTVDIWETNKVPIKIVKVKNSHGMETLLLEYGKGAKTKITEKPVPFNMQNFIMNMK